MEKKKYIAPALLFVEIDLDIIALSKDDKYVQDEEQMSNEYRGGDWNNIWNMQ